MKTSFFCCVFSPCERAALGFHWMQSSWMPSVESCCLSQTLSQDSSVPEPALLHATDHFSALCQRLLTLKMWLFFFFLQWSLGLPGMWEYFDTWIFNTSCSSQSVEKCFNNLEFNLWIFYCLGRLLASMCKLIMRRKCATLCLFSKCYQWMLFFFLFILQLSVTACLRHPLTKYDVYSFWYLVVFNNLAVTLSSEKSKSTVHLSK